MKRAIILAAVTCLLLTCKKKKDDPEPTPEFSETNLQGVDYIDYNPDPHLHSITRYGDPNPPSGLYVGLPADTSCALTFTLPGEPLSTIIINAGNYFDHTNNGSGAAQNYKHALTFSLTSNDQTISYGMDCATILSSGQIPNTASNVRWISFVSLNQPSPQNCTFTGEGYLPIKRLIPGKRISYGWVLLAADINNGVTVKEAAFNRVHDTPLPCGTKQ